MAALLSEPRKKTYVAQGHVWALKISSIIYQDFIKKHSLLAHILKRRTNKNILINLHLFENMASSFILNNLSQSSLEDKSIKIVRFLLEKDPS